MSTFRYVAPAGSPIGATDLARCAARLVSDRDPQASLRAAVREIVGVDYASVVSTGRAGMTLILRALRTLAGPSRDEVILPSYTCFSVAASIVKAGLVPRVADVAVDTLDYDHQRLEQLDTRRVLAVIATNLYGMPNDLPRLSRFARERGLFLIDDAAQALGARVGGRNAGTWGDAGLYSFDKGKNVSAIDGGVIVTGSGEVQAAIEREVGPLPAPGWRHAVESTIKLAGYSMLLRPSLYWIPQSIPQLGLGITPFRTDYPLESPGRLLPALAVTMLHRLEQFNRSRSAVAAQLTEGLSSISAITALTPVAGTEPVYLRLPVLAPNTTARQRMVAALNAAGIGATQSYPASIGDIPELRGILRGGDDDWANGRVVASRIITLPTHPYVRSADVDLIVSTLRANDLFGRSSTMVDAVAQ